MGRKKKIDTSPAKLELFPTSVRDFLSVAVNLSESGIFYEPTCPICSHPLRVEIDTYYKSFDKFKKNKVDDVHVWLQVEKGTELPKDALKNHLENHVDYGDREYRKIEYTNKVRNIASLEMTTLDRIKFALAAVNERLIALASANMSEEKKSRGMNDLLKTYLSLISLQSNLMGEMEDRGDIYKISRDHFEKAFDTAFATAANESEKKLVAGLLTDLTDSFIQDAEE